MWFKNLKIFTISQPLDYTAEDLSDKLSEFPFTPCGSQETGSQGWTSPLGAKDHWVHSANGCHWLTLKTQERLLPGAVVNAELEERIADIEAETGSPVPKKAKSELKQEIKQRLLPQAFCRNSFIHGVVCPAENLVLVDASSDAKAENFLASLRKVLGSLPVLPLARRSASAELTTWVTDQPAQGFEVLQDAEISSLDEEGGTIRFKGVDLGADEVLAHIKDGNMVSKLGIQWGESMTAVIEEDLSVKRLKFTDVIKEQNEDIPKDQKLARLDADFALMSGELLKLCEDLKVAFPQQD